MDIEKGDKTVVTVLKIKNGVPTKIEMGGHIYVLVHPHQYRGGKKK